MQEQCLVSHHMFHSAGDAVQPAICRGTIIINVSSSLYIVPYTNPILYTIPDQYNTLKFTYTLNYRLKTLSARLSPS